MNSVIDHQQFDRGSALVGTCKPVVSELCDNLGVARHLLKAAIMACDSIEDLESRNGFVALLAEIDSKVADATEVLGDL